MKDVEALQALRSRFRQTDRQLLKLLAKRCALAQQMGALKQQQHLQVVQPEVWQKQLARRRTESLALGIRPEFVLGVFQLLHRESVRIQQAEINKVK
ncbi:MAG: chorismate mutase [Chitinophagales bacterium]